MQSLKEEIRAFASERDWEKYHSPKNLAIGLSIEVAELLEIFLWLTESESKHLNDKQLIHLKEEIGDVLIYLVNLADKFGLDPVDCARDKVILNKSKYPSQIVKGCSKKYNEYESSGPPLDVNGIKK